MMKVSRAHSKHNFFLSGFLTLIVPPVLSTKILSELRIKFLQHSHELQLLYPTYRKAVLH